MGRCKEFFQKGLKAEIVRVFSLNAISTFIKMCTGLISTKVVANIIGPSGVALIGQLGSINTILQGIASGGISSGLTKYIAEYRSEESKIKSYISNGLYVASLFTFIVSLICILANRYLSNKIMLSAEYGYIFLILGFTIFLFTINSILISILNGYKEFTKYVIVNISTSIFSLLFSVILCLIWKLKGAMISAVTFQSIVLIVTIIQCRKCSWFRLSYFIQSKFDINIVKQYLQYILMTLVSLSIIPLSQIILRSYVISNISITEAGWWEAMNRISNMYLSVITTSLSIYILPRMSEINDKFQLKQELIKYYKFIIPLLLGCIVLIYLLRHLVVWLLYNPEFYPMEKLFIWQLIGDFFKITSWILSYLMLAKSMTKEFIITEIFFGLLMLGLSYFFVRNFGTVGLNIGYMINYIIYFLVMLILFRDIIFSKNSKVI